MTAIVVISALILSHVALIPGIDLGDTCRFVMSAVGCSALLWYKEVPKAMLPCFAFVGWLLVRSMFGYVPGFTFIHIGAWIGAAGLLLASSHGDEKVLLWGIVVVGVLNLLFKYSPLNEHVWARGAINDGWEHGIFRHRIRYSTMLFAGIVACARLYRLSDKTPSVLSIVSMTALCYGVIDSDCNTIIACTALYVWMLVTREAGWKGAVITGVFAGVMLWFAPREWLLFDHRLMLWGDAWDGVKGLAWIFGNGVGAWTLTQGVAGHPHNEIIHTWYNTGLIGVALATLSAGSCLLWSLRSFELTFGVMLLLLSTLTNSARYPEVLAVSMIMLGICAGGMHENKEKHV
jgi:hypothetical protein